MSIQFLVIFPLILATALGLILSFSIARNRRAPGAWALLVLALGASLWSLGYALEISASDLALKVLWAKYEYLGITVIPAAWAIFVVQYNHRSNRVNTIRRYGGFLLVVPAVTLVLAWTNGTHHLVWQQLELQPIGPMTMLHVQHGPWFWVYWTFAYGLLLWGSANLARGVLQRPRLQRWQISLALSAITLPWIGNLMYVTGLSPLPGLDWTPVLFIASCLLFAIGLFNLHLGNIVPIAHQKIFSGLTDGLFVLDLNGYIADLNPAAQAILGPSSASPIGELLSQAFPPLAAWLEKGSLVEQAPYEFTIRGDAGQRVYEAYHAPLTGFRSIPIGSQVILHDITHHKKEQAELVRKKSQQIYQALFENAADSIFLVDLEGSIQQINQKAADLLGYRREELQTMTVWDLVAPQDYPGVKARWGQLLDGKSLKPFIRPHRKKNGEFIPLENNVTLVRDADGQPQYYQNVARDITERITAEQEQNRLLEEIKQSNKQMRELAFRLQEAQESERQALAAELHDRVGPNLTGLNLNLQIIQNQLGPETKIEVRKRLQESLEIIETTTHMVRNVMAELDPPVLKEYGLTKATEWYCREIAHLTGITTHIAGGAFEPRLSPNIEKIVFRLVQEALNNVAKHARATTVTILFESSPQAYIICVEDDGVGFDRKEIDQPSRPPHWGLLTMQQRAASIEAALEIDTLPGRGTKVSIRIPRAGL